MQPLPIFDIPQRLRSKNLSRLVFAAKDEFNPIIKQTRDDMWIEIQTPANLIGIILQASRKTVHSEVRRMSGSQLRASQCS
jgi:hypothetical protein